MKNNVIQFPRCSNNFPLGTEAFGLITPAFNLGGGFFCLQCVMSRRYIAYARVSDDGQLDNSSLASQERLAVEWASSQGWHHVTTIRDQGSRDTLDRSHTKKLFDLLEEGEADTVVIYKVDRAGGESEVFSRLFGRIYSLGATVAIVEKRQLFENLIDLMHQTVFDRAVSEYELFSIRKRTSQGTIDHLERGSFLMNPLFGYVLAREMKDGININRPVVHNEQAQVVQHVIRSIAEGASVPEVCKDLNDRGVPSPFRKGWNGTTIRNMVREHGSKYAGEPWPYSRQVSKTKRVEVTYQYPPLVTLDEVLEARRSLDVNRGGTYKTRPFQGLITCSKCKRKAAIRTSGGKWWTSACNSYATWHNYSSSGKDIDFQPCSHHISVGQIEKKLRKWLADDGEYSLMHAIVRLHIRYDGVFTARRFFENQLSKAETERAEIAKKIVGLDSSKYGSVLDLLNDELGSVEEKMERAQAEIKKTHTDEPKIREVFNRLGLELREEKKGMGHRRNQGTEAWEASIDFHSKVGQLLDSLNRKDAPSINKVMRELGIKISADYSLPDREERLASIKVTLDYTELAGVSSEPYEAYGVPSSTR